MPKHSDDDSIPRDELENFLRSVPNLSEVTATPERLVAHFGYFLTARVLDALFRDSQAIVVILSPDEYVELRQDLLGADSNRDQGWQPRPNVFIEAGMALAKDEAHTILVQIGPIRPASDLLGRNLINLDNSPAQRHTLAQRLLTAGCSAVTTGTDWLRAGGFRIPSRELKQQRRRIE